MLQGERASDLLVYREKELQNSWCREKELENSWCREKALENSWCREKELLTSWCTERKSYRIVGVQGERARE